MEYEVSKRQKRKCQSNALLMAEHFTSPTVVIESNDTHHFFRKYLWMGNWGICSMDKRYIFVPAKPNYLYADILVDAQVLIAGSAETGWDVYSLEGELVEHLSPMSFAHAKSLLNEKKRNSNR